MKVKKCVYLDKLGIKEDEYFGNYCYKDEVRSERWEEEREKYGFDSRETWNFDISLAEFIYTRLKRYQEVSIVDTDACVFAINDKKVTMTKLLQDVVDNCEYYILNKCSSDGDKEKLAYDKMKNALVLLGEFSGAIWW